MVVSNSFCPSGRLVMNHQEFADFASNYLGRKCLRYSGPENGCTPSGFDCSGFVNFILREAGYVGDIPRHSNEMFDNFGILIHYQAIRPGDLIFFTRGGGLLPRHVGIMITEDSYIHSPGKDGTSVCIESVLWENIVPGDKGTQLYFINPIGFKRIMVEGEGRYKLSFFD